jgi:putative glycosyltransferase (TIGR04372 family)
MSNFGRLRDRGIRLFKRGIQASKRGIRANIQMRSLTNLRGRGVRANAEGRPDEALECWIAMMRKQTEINGGHDPVRYLRGESWTNGIGHIAFLDFFVKRRLLGLKESQYVIVTSPKFIANSYYLSLWQPYFEFATSGPLNMDFYADWPMVLEVQGQWLPLETAVDQINEIWHNQNRAPAISMPDDMTAKGWAHLRSIGIAASWFVTLHARQGGLYGDDHSVRNIADIRTYRSAIKRINDTGGAVIRIGAGKAEPVDGLIDLGGSPDWLDTFLISRCRFFIGSNSGPSVAACTFGVPVLICNFAPRNSLFPHPVTLLRKHVRNADGEEVGLSDPAGMEWSKDRLAKEGWTSVDNTEAEIAEAVEGMLA